MLRGAGGGMDAGPDAGCSKGMVGGVGGDWCGSTAKKIKYIERGPTRPREVVCCCLVSFLARGRWACGRGRVRGRVWRIPGIVGDWEVGSGGRE